MNRPKLPLVLVSKEQVLQKFNSRMWVGLIYTFRKLVQGTVKENDPGYRHRGSLIWVRERRWQQSLVNWHGTWV